MKKKIIYIVNEDWYFVSHRLNLAKEAIKKGYSVSLYANISNSEKEIVDSGIRVHPGKFTRSFSFFKDLYSIYHLNNILKVSNPDVLHTVALKAVGISLIASIFHRSRRIHAISGLGSTFTQKNFKNLVLKTLIGIVFKVLMRKKRDSIIVQNTSDYNILKKILPKIKISLIKGAGVDTEVFQPNDSKSTGTFKVLLASRLLWSKGIREFLESAQALTIKHSNISFFIAGKLDSGNSDSLSKGELENISKLNYINFLGNINNMELHLPHYNLFVLPTYYGEGVPKVLIEAASCGIPIITTDSPGCNDIVVDSSNGFLIKPRSSQELTQRIEQIYSMTECEKEKLASFSRRLVMRIFSSDIIYADTIKLYHD